MKLIPIIMSILGLTSCGDGFKNVSVEEFAELISKDGVQLLDVRTPEEYAQGHIARSAEIDYKSATFEADAIAFLDKTKPVAIYCRSGRRSAEAAKILTRSGYDLYNLETGIIGWQEAKMPVTTLNYGSSLVLYYSQNGSTAALAEELRRQTGSDIERFDVEEVYDGTFEETIARCLKERESGFIPTLKPISSVPGAYDVIFLGYPIWFGTYAPAVKALLASADLSGIKIVPFCTFGSGGLNSSTADLKAALPGNEILPGFGARTIHASSCTESLSRFLIENGFKAGGIKPLPPYSDPTPVTPEEAAIFEEACGDYQFPMGTPVTAGSRTVDGGTDYIFTAESTDPAGAKAAATVYISVREGQKAYFTMVNR